MKKNLPYFESYAEVANYLGMTVPEFLKARAEGKIGVTERPKDATAVYWKCDVEKWNAANRPVAWLTPDPAGVSTKAEVQNG